MNKNLKTKIASIMALTLAIGMVYNGNVVKASEEVRLITKEIIVEKPLDFKGEVKGLEVNLTWKAPENKEGLIGYTLYKDGKPMVELDSTATSYKVEELRENTIYGFKIVSNYSNGKVSKPVSINIRTEIIKAKARDFAAKDVTSNSLMLTWNKPEYPGGLIGYSIYQNGKLIAQLDTKLNKYEVTGLKGNSIYSFKIICNYTNGDSKPLSLNIRTKR